MSWDINFNTNVLMKSCILLFFRPSGLLQFRMHSGTMNTHIFGRDQPNTRLLPTLVPTQNKLGTVHTMQLFWSMCQWLTLVTGTSDIRIVWGQWPLRGWACRDVYDFITEIMYVVARLVGDFSRRDSPEDSRPVTYAHKLSTSSCEVPVIFDQN